ncbi:MAG: type II secretion system protein GspM [Deltaproteobacteria bacterium]|nr:type II secretion system protein GspM [Deltaproteobacteria bacterium]
MSIVTSYLARWELLPPRTRLLLAAAAAVIAFVFTYHTAVGPLAEATSRDQTRHEANLRKLAAVEGASSRSLAPSAFAGKTLAGLSAARVVEALTQAAHQNGIQRITFKTGAIAPASQPSADPAPPVNVVRMPVSVEIEAQGGDFANYLDALAKLPIPLSIESFEMKVDKALDPALRIRMELEAYGKPA